MFDLANSDHIDGPHDCSCLGDAPLIEVSAVWYTREVLCRDWLTAFTIGAASTLARGRGFFAADAAVAAPELFTLCRLPLLGLRCILEGAARVHRRRTSRDDGTDGRDGITSSAGRQIPSPFRMVAANSPGRLWTGHEGIAAWPAAAHARPPDARSLGGNHAARKRRVHWLENSCIKEGSCSKVKASAQPRRAEELHLAARGRSALDALRARALAWHAACGT